MSRGASLGVWPSAVRVEADQELAVQPFLEQMRSRLVDSGVLDKSGAT